MIRIHKGRIIHRIPLLILIVACTLTGGCGRSRPAAEVSALERVQQLGGKVGIDSQSPGQPVEGIDFSKTSIEDSDLACLEPFPGLRWLFLDETKITNGALAKLGPYKQLQNLSLGGTQVGDAGLAHLSGLSGLRRLNLGRTAVTDAGLENLASLSGLKVLDLTAGTQLSTASLATLKERLPKLVVLK